MKNFNLFCLFFFNLAIINFANAQILTSPTCSSILVAQPGANIFDTGDLYISGFCGVVFTPLSKTDVCNFSVGSNCQPAANQYQLMLVASGGDIVMSNWTINTTFNNLSHGTYYVNQRSPIPKTPTAQCPKPLAFNNIGQQIGFIGQWTFSKSNEMVVGATVQNDMSWNFTGTSPFGSNAEIKMDVTNTKNYDIWWLGIFEIGGKNRSWSQGWSTGLIPFSKTSPTKRILDLKQLPGGPFANGNFLELPVKYRVQFAIAKQQCNTVWTNLDRDFAICPASLGCRSDEDQAIILSPNPASNTFKLNNIDVSAESQTKVFVTDISGRTVKAFEVDGQDDFDISDLNSGLYLVSVMNNGGRIFTTKLSVSK
jgi:hypothetical protein